MAGRKVGYSDKANRCTAKNATRTDTRAMKELANAATMDVWYFQVEVAEVVKAFNLAAKHAQ